MGLSFGLVFGKMVDDWIYIEWFVNLLLNIFGKGEGILEVFSFNECEYVFFLDLVRW